MVPHLFFPRPSHCRHPDKAKDKDKDIAEDMFVDISKAYKTLTDDDTRKNWEEYGNPDGRQSFSFGIALPSWIVDPENKAAVLGVYAILFGLLLPYVVGRWWSKSKKFSKDGVLNYSMGLFVRELKEGSLRSGTIMLTRRLHGEKDD
jgi:translocation protein SEC63